MKTPNKTIALTLLSFTNSLAFVPDRNLPVRHMARANKNSRALSILASTVFDESEFQGEFQPAQRLSNMFKEDIGAIQIDGRPLPLMGSSNGVLPLPISTKLNIYCLIERVRKQKTNTYYSQRQKSQLLDLIIRKMIQLKEQYNPTKHQVQRGPGPGSRLNVYGEEVTFTHLISVLNELSEVDENCKVMLNKHITQNLRANTVVFAYMYYALENAKLYNDESEHLTFCEQCVDLSIRSLKEPDILTPGYINELKKCVEKVLCAIIKEDIK